MTGNAMTDLLTDAQRAAIYQAQNQGYVVGSGEDDWPLFNDYLGWCQANDRPFLAIRHDGEYAELWLDMHYLPAIRRLTAAQQDALGCLFRDAQTQRPEHGPPYALGNEFCHCDGLAPELAEQAAPEILDVVNRWFNPVLELEEMGIELTLTDEGIRWLASYGIDDRARQLLEVLQERQREAVEFMLDREAARENGYA